MNIPVKNALTGKVELLPSQEIICIERAKDRVWIHTKRSVYVTISSLKDYADLLETKGFSLVNQSKVVNKNYIESYDKRTNTILLKGGKKAHVSRRKAYLMDFEEDN